ncbi:MAG: hypothetical protein NZ516_09945, partial [Raineya sp.]|nr:hypothetical protein [Raineya sp.]
MRNLILLFGFLLIVTPLFAQLKVFKGTAKDEFDIVGNLIYTYYEKNGDIIKEGDFSFSKTIADGSSFSLKGKFKNNKRNGMWNFLLINKQSVGTFILKVDASYSDGIPDGLWQAIRTANGKQVYSIKMTLKKGNVIGFNLETVKQGNFDIIYYGYLLNASLKT